MYLIRNSCNRSLIGLITLDDLLGGKGLSEPLTEAYLINKFHRLITLMVSNHKKRNKELVHTDT